MPNSYNLDYLYGDLIIMISDVAKKYGYINKKISRLSERIHNHKDSTNSPEAWEQLTLEGFD